MIWLLAAALASETPWWVGLPVADVVLVAPEGGLPDESLEPLLRTDTEKKLSPHAIRSDLETLFRVGGFAGVRADVSPWPAWDGEAWVEGALVTFEVSRAPTISSIEVTGLKRSDRRQILGAAGLAKHETYYEGLDAPLTESRAMAWLAKEGFPEAQATVQVKQDDGGVGVLLDLDPGPPNTLQELVFTGVRPEVASIRELERWAHREGLVVGKPIGPDAVNAARHRIRTALASTRSNLFRKRRGFTSVRVVPSIHRTSSGSEVAFAVEPGPRLHLEVEGIPFFGERKVREALGIDERLRLTAGYVDAADERLVAYLQERGWLLSSAQVSVTEESDTARTLRVTVDEGARHRLARGSFPRWVGVDFQGNEHLSDAALQTVMDQASDTLRRDVYTQEALETALKLAKDRYRAEGFLDAELHTTDVSIARPGGLLRRALGAPWRAVTGRKALREVTPEVTVTEGEPTLLVNLTIAGTVEVEDTWSETAEGLLDGPFSPTALESLATSIVLAHREEGYLEATGAVRSTKDAPLARSATIEISAGPRVLLRSVVTRGTRITRPALVRREVKLVRGEPVRPSDLAKIRASLSELGIFRNTQLELLGEQEARDLVVNVSERARWSFEAGGGVNTDQGLRTFARATRRNILGLAHRLDIVGEIGLDYRSENLRDWVPDLTNPEWRAAVSYTAPRFPLRSQRLVTDIVLRERRQERTWRIDRTGAGIAVESKLAAQTQLRLGVRMETRQLVEVDAGALLPDEPWTALVGDSINLPSPWRLQEAINALIIHDMRDDLIAPSRGALFSLTTEVAPGIQLQEATIPASFAKAEARFSGYVPLAGLILHVGAGGGVARSPQRVVPLEDRFRLGGTTSLRGFRRDSVGPRNVAPPVSVAWPDGIDQLVDYAGRDNPERWVPTGGDTMASGTIEIFLPLPALGLTRWEGYSGVLFADTGNVWLLDTAFQTDSQEPETAALIPPLRLGVGAGARIATPIGPLQFDVGVNPHALSANDAQRRLLAVRFEEPWIRAHLSLGATF